MFLYVQLYIVSADDRVDTVFLHVLVKRPFLELDLLKCMFLAWSSLEKSYLALLKCLFSNPALFKVCQLRALFR